MVLRDACRWRSWPARGHDTLLRPAEATGTKRPQDRPLEPYAVVQLRKDNAQGSIYNLVGFQTHLRFPEQKVFSMIPALTRRGIPSLRGDAPQHFPGLSPGCWTAFTRLRRSRASPLPGR